MNLISVEIQDDGMIWDFNFNLYKWIDDINTQTHTHTYIYLIKRLRITFQQFVYFYYYYSRQHDDVGYDDVIIIIIIIITKTNSINSVEQPRRREYHIAFSFYQRHDDISVMAGFTQP